MKTLDKKPAGLVDRSLIDILKVIAKQYNADVNILIKRALHDYIIQYLEDELNK